MYTPIAGVCLLGASISAIAAVGSVFEIASGNPEWGMLTTGGILAASIPMTVVLFLTAVKNSD
jgi:F0F1-type ATP synthase membrane subunit c/vacuolar-type H+-ATPase subunit K